MKRINWGRVLVGAWLVCLMGFLLTGCGESETVKGETDLVEYENTNVVCYRVRMFEGLWCYRKDQGPSCPGPGH